MQYPIDVLNQKILHLKRLIRIHDEELENEEFTPELKKRILDRQIIRRQNIAEAESAIEILEKENSGSVPV